MHQHLKPADALVGERVQALHTIWRRAAGERHAPRRADITLRELGKLTSWLMVFDVVDAGADYTIRLTGDGLVRFFETNLAGQRLSALDEKPFFRTAMELLQHCVRRAEPVGFGPTISNFENKQHWECEFVFLPLSDDGKTVTGVIGTMDLSRSGALYAEGDSTAISSSI